MTLPQLQGKAWYRLLKVGIVLIFLALYGAIVAHTLDRHRTYDAFNPSASMIHCQLGNQSSFSFQSIGATTTAIRANPFRHKIQELCAIEPSGLLAEVAPAANTGRFFLDEPKDCPWGCSFSGSLINAGFTDEQINELPKKQLLKYSGEAIVTTEHKYDLHRNWDKILFVLLSGFVLLLIVFEILKRVFYYIIFGTFFPKAKNKESE